MDRLHLTKTLSRCLSNDFSHPALHQEQSHGYEDENDRLEFHGSAAPYKNYYTFKELLNIFIIKKVDNGRCIHIFQFRNIFFAAKDVSAHGNLFLLISG